MLFKIELTGSELGHVIRTGALEKLVADILSQEAPSLRDMLIPEAPAPVEAPIEKITKAPKAPKATKEPDTKVEAVEEKAVEVKSETQSEPTTASAVTAKVITMEDVRQALMAAQKEGFKPKLLIESYGATNLSAIPSDKYGELLDRLASLLEEMKNV